MADAEILVDRSPGETRAAVLEDGRLAELHIERDHRPWLFGALVLARVTASRPEQGAVFVDLGGAQGYLETSKVSRPTEGETILVEVTAEPHRDKAARVTRDVTLSGDLVTLTPSSPEHAVARRITAKTERAAFRTVLSDTLPEGMGALVRAEARGVDAALIRRDIAALLDRWRGIEEQVKSGALGVVQPSPGPIGLARRAALGAPVTEGRDGRLFREHGVEEMIEAALERRVALDGGGVLTFDETEALVAVDVDTAASRSGTADLVGLARDAARRIVQEVRSRRLAGLIVVDFPRTRSAKPRDALADGLKQGFGAGDEMPTLHGWTRGGLFEITRPRRGPSLRQTMLGDAMLVGAGVETQALAALRRALTETSGIARPRLICPNAVRLALSGPLRAALDETGRRLGAPLALETGDDAGGIRIEGG